MVHPHSMDKQRLIMVLLTWSAVLAGASVVGAIGALVYAVMFSTSPPPPVMAGIVACLGVAAILKMVEEVLDTFGRG